MIETKQQGMGEQLRNAVLQQALDAGVSSSVDGVVKGNIKEKKPVVSPRSGAVLPQGKGRPPGVKNKLINLRDAVLEAFEMAGGAQYLYQLSQGTSSDRAAFTGLVAKVLPTQINANVEGGIQVQLSWLGQRQIGTTQTQPADVVTQVIDLQKDSGGKYRIADQNASDIAGGVQAGAEQKGAEGAQST